MERKSRYCPQCGLKTNDMRCEICDRPTKRVTERVHESYLNLVSDDIETFDHIETLDQMEVKNKAKSEQREDIVDDMQVDLDNVKKNVRPHRNPKTSATSFSTSSFDQIKEKLKAVFTVVMVIVVIGNVIYSMTRNDSSLETSTYEQDYSEYLSAVEESTPYDFTVITKDNGEMYGHLVNASPYYLQMRFYDTSDDSPIDVGPHMYIEPYSDRNFTVFTTDINSEVIGTYDLDFHKPTISYVYEIDKDGYSQNIIKLKEVPSEEEIDNLMQHIFAGKQIDFGYNDVNIHVQVDNEERSEQLYDCMLYLRDGLIAYYEDGEIIREIEVNI